MGDIIFTVSEYANDISRYKITTNDLRWTTSTYGQINSFDSVYYVDLFAQMKYITDKCNNGLNCGCLFEIE